MSKPMWIIIAILSVVVVIGGTVYYLQQVSSQNQFWAMVAAFETRASQGEFDRTAYLYDMMHELTQGVDDLPEEKQIGIRDAIQTFNNEQSMLTSKFNSGEISKGEWQNRVNQSIVLMCQRINKYK